MTNLKTMLNIHQLALSVKLGWGDQERQQTQTILLDISILFPQPPRAIETDQSQDTLCYDNLIDTIQHYISTKHFRLIEHLAAEIHRFIKTQLPPSIKLCIRLTKFPAIQALPAGVSISLEDE